MKRPLAVVAILVGISGCEGSDSDPIPIGRTAHVPFTTDANPLGKRNAGVNFYNDDGPLATLRPGTSLLMVKPRPAPKTEPSKGPTVKFRPREPGQARVWVKVLDGPLKDSVGEVTRKDIRPGKPPKK